MPTNKDKFFIKCYFEEIKTLIETLEKLEISEKVIEQVISESTILMHRYDEMSRKMARIAKNIDHTLKPKGLI
jgi:hypothetical protein